MHVARPDLASRLPQALRAIVDRVAGEGRAWLVGGTVRDLLRGETPRDYDIATDLEPAAVGRLFAEADLKDARMGTTRVRCELGEVSLTTLRADGAYLDHRRPQAVRFVRDLEQDSARRDFTVNALYYDVAAGQVTDHVGGLADLEAGVLRTIGEPGQRFAEDGLRLLRLVRFAARCDFAIAPATAAAARSGAAGLQRLAPERVFQELDDAFTGPGRGAALRLLVSLDLAGVLLPEIAAMDGVTQPPEYHPEGDVLTHVAMVLDAVPAGDSALSWSAVLHDVGKPPTWRQAEDRIRFDGHDVLSASMARDILGRFRVSKALIDLVVEICRDHIRFAALPQMRPRRREAWLRSPRFEKHLQFHRADCMASHGNLEIHDFAARELAALEPEFEPLVTGQDVLALGIGPGPEVGEIIERVHAAADQAPMPMDREAALELLRNFAAERRQGDDRRTR